MGAVGEGRGAGGELTRRDMDGMGGRRAGGEKRGGELDERKEEVEGRRAERREWELKGSCKGGEGTWRVGQGSYGG